MKGLGGRLAAGTQSCFEGSGLGGPAGGPPGVPGLTQDRAGRLGGSRTELNPGLRGPGRGLCAGRQGGAPEGSRHLRPQPWLLNSQLRPARRLERRDGGRAVSPSPTLLFPAPISPPPSLALPASGSVSFVCCPLILPILSPPRGSPPPPAVSEGGVPAPGGLPCPAAHPGRHAALLLPLRCPPGAAAGLSDRGKTCPATADWPQGPPPPVPGSLVLGAGGAPGSPSGRSTLMPALLPTAADLRHRGEDDRDLHPLLGAGSLRCHACHQGFRWVLPEPPWRWAGTQGALGEEGSQGSGAGGIRKGRGGRAPGL